VRVQLPLGERAVTLAKRSLERSDLDVDAAPVNQRPSLLDARIEEAASELGVCEHDGAQALTRLVS
jgi:hypothetical protein